MRLLALCLMTIFGAPVWGQAEADRLSPGLEAFQEELREILQETDTPGLGAVVATRDKLVWAGGLGVEDKVSERPVTENTLFRMGSISKSFVALAAMMLVEEGRLDLQTPLRELAPEIEFTNRWEETDPVRMVHLMEHTTGWDDLAFREYAQNFYPPLTLREGLAFDPRSRKSRWPPGRSMSYCNSGPAVAAYVIQKLAGKNFEDFVRDRIFLPLDMPTANFGAEGTLSIRLATGYKRGKRVDYWNILLRPSGAINTTPREMANYLRFYLNEGELEDLRLVKPESIDRMKEARTPRAVKAGVEQWDGLNIGRYVKEGQIWYGHTGGLDGYRADMAWCPALEVGYVLMVNSSTGGGFEKLRTAFRKFLTKDREPIEAAPRVSLAAGVLDSFAGYYLPITPRAERGRFLAPFFGVLKVRAGSEDLAVSSVQGMEETLVPTGERVFRKSNEPLASVVFYAGEAEGEASFGTGKEYRRVSPVFVWSHWILGGAALLLMASSLLFALIWIPRLLFGRKLPREPFLSARVLPFLCTLAFVVAAGIIATSQGDAISRFGTLTPWSVGFTVATILFAIAAAAGLCVSFSAKRGAINRGVRWHSLLVSGAQMILALYLAAWGIIGLQSWM